MAIENQITHQIIKSGDQKFVAEIDSRGEIIKTWEAGPKSIELIDNINKNLTKTEPVN